MKNEKTNPLVHGSSLLELKDEKAFDQQFVSECDRTMVGFVQQYSDGSQFIPPQNQQFVQEYIEEFNYVESEAKEKQQSMKNHKVVCFFGE